MASPFSPPPANAPREEHLEAEPVASDTSARMLFARIQILAREARSIAIVSPRSGVPVASLAGRLASAFREAGQIVAVIHLESDVLSASALEEMVASQPDSLIVAGGLLDNPNALLSAAAVDAVILLARREKTRRSDLTTSRMELESVGARLLLAVMLE
ncbi:MAG: hypothetical protein ACRDFS_07660 [Chloroflexota bacterium]